MIKKSKHMQKIMSFIMSRNEIGTLLPLLIMCVVIGSVNTAFFAPANLVDVLRTTSYSFIIAAPLTGLMISGGVDLTIGAVTNLGGIVCAWGMVNLGLPILPSILMTMAAGAFIGVLKSLIVVKANLPGFIMTLGLQYVINGFILITTSGNPVTGFQKAFKVLGQGKVFGNVYWSIIAAVVVGVLAQIMLSKSKYGRSLFAAGGNAETAKLAGINVDRVKMIMDIIVSVFAALCGVFMASRFNSAQPAVGSGTELTIMAAVIIGGTSMFGGTGSVVGTFLGCLLLAVVNNGLILMHVSSFWTNFIFGGILIASLFIDKYRRSKSIAC